MPNKWAKLAILRKRILENTVEGHLYKRCKELRIPCLKLKGPRGWPDDTVLWPGGCPSLVETKRPKGGVFQPLQLRTHAKLRLLGYDVVVCKNKDEVDDFIKERKHLCKHFSRTLISVKVPKHSIPSASEIRGLKRRASSSR